MAPRDSLPVCDRPDQAPDPLMALVRLLARQAAGEALHGEKRGGEGAPDLASGVEEAPVLDVADGCQAAVPTGGGHE
jgi:hypothetical protein